MVSDHCHATTALPPMKEPQSPLKGGLVGPGDAVEKRKVSCPYQESNHDSSDV